MITLHWTTLALSLVSALLLGETMDNNDWFEFKIFSVIVELILIGMFLMHVVSS